MRTINLNEQTVSSDLTQHILADGSLRLDANQTKHLISWIRKVELNLSALDAAILKLRKEITDKYQKGEQSNEK